MDASVSAMKTPPKSTHNMARVLTPGLAGERSGETVVVVMSTRIAAGQTRYQESSYTSTDTTWYPATKKAMMIA